MSKALASRVREAAGGELLGDAGAEVLNRELPMPHTIDPSFVEALRPWLAAPL